MIWKDATGPETKNKWQFSQYNALNLQFQISSNFSVQNDSKGPQVDPDLDPRKEIEVDPYLDPERRLKWIRIRPNAVDPDPDTKRWKIMFTLVRYLSQSDSVIKSLYYLYVNNVYFQKSLALSPIY